MDKEKLLCEIDEYIHSIYECGRNKDGLYEKRQLRGAILHFAEPREKRIAELEAQIEKLLDFVLSKIECCDVCPITTDTCINSEGTCPYAGILSKGEEAVTREWLMQKIAKEIKEK